MIEEQMNGQRKGHEKGRRTGTCAMNNDHDYHHCSAMEGEERRQGRGRVRVYLLEMKC